MQARLEAHWVLERTEAGHLEIAQRARKLPLQMRAVLIMVDGKSELHQLLKKMSGMTDGVSILQALMHDGLVRRRPHTADIDVMNAQAYLQASRALVEQTLEAKTAHPPPPPSFGRPEAVPAAPVATTGQSNRRRSLALSRLYLMDQIERMFGPQSDAVRNLLRNATTREALLEAFVACREILVETSGEERAQRVEVEFMNMLPEPAAPSSTSTV